MLHECILYIAEKLVKWPPLMSCIIVIHTVFCIDQISWVLPGTDAASTLGPTKEQAGTVEAIPVLIHLKSLKVCCL